MVSGSLASTRNRSVVSAVLSNPSDCGTRPPSLADSPRSPTTSDTSAQSPPAQHGLRAVVRCPARVVDDEARVGARRCHLRVRAEATRDPRAVEHPGREPAGQRDPGLHAGVLACWIRREPQ